MKDDIKALRPRTPGKGPDEEFSDASIEITVYSKVGGVLTKKIFLSEDGFDDRALQPLAVYAELDPPEAIEPTAIEQRPQEAVGVGTVTRHDVTVQPSRQAFTSIGTPQPGAGGRAYEMRDGAQGGQHLRQRTPEFFEAIGNSLRYPAAVVIQQHESPALLAIDDLVLDAGNRVGLPIELSPAEYLDLIG